MLQTKLKFSMFVFHEREKQDMKLLSLQLCLLKAVLCCEDPRPVISDLMLIQAHANF